jgi:hypothetical protein
MAQSAGDTKYRNRARLETWAAHRGDRVQYRRDPVGWTVTLVVTQEPETIVYESSPQESIEAGCVEVIGYIAEAGLQPPK